MILRTPMISVKWKAFVGDFKSSNVYTYKRFADFKFRIFCLKRLLDVKQKFRVTW